MLNNNNKKIKPQAFHINFITFLLITQHIGIILIGQSQLCQIIKKKKIEYIITNRIYNLKYFKYILKHFFLFIYLIRSSVISRVKYIWLAVK